MPQFNTEDLIQYLYRETTEEKTKAMEKAIAADWKLKEKLGALEESTHQLDTIITGPRDKTILAILNYAKSTAIAEHP